MRRPHPIEQFAQLNGLSQPKAAERLGISKATFWQIVNGARGVSVAMAARLEAASNGEVSALEILRWHLDAASRQAS